MLLIVSAQKEREVFHFVLGFLLFCFFVSLCVVFFFFLNKLYFNEN